MASRTEKGMTMEEVSTSFDSNKYATKKSIANSVLNLSLLIATVKQLKEVVDDNNKMHREFLLILLAFSIAIQATIGFGLLTMAFHNINKTTDKKIEEKEGQKKIKPGTSEDNAGGDGGANGASSQSQSDDDDDEETPQQRNANNTNYVVLVSSSVLLGVIVFIDIFGEFNTEIPPSAAATTTVAATR